MLLDSCVSSHITDQPSHFTELPVKKWIKLVDSYIKASYVGGAVTEGRRGQQFLLHRLVPGLSVNLVP